MIKYFLFYLFSVLIGAFSQILLKMGARRGIKRTLILSFINTYTITAYIFLILSTLFSLYSLRVLPLKYTIIIMPFGYFFVGFLSFLILKESFSKVKIVGAIIIIVGIIIFNLKLLYN